MPIDWTYKYQWQYGYAKAYLADLKQFSPDWVDLVLPIQQLMTDTGFDGNHAAVLTRLRERIANGSKGKPEADCAKNILTAVNSPVGTQSTPIAYAPKMAAAGLKFLQHTYMLENAGAHFTWLLSLPTSITNWPSMEMHMAVTTTTAAYALLQDGAEHFTEQQKKDLKGAAMHALHWVQRANICLANAASTSSAAPAEKEKAEKLVRRWFADPSTIQAQLDQYIGELTTGFKGIAGSLTQGRFILTDWVPLRKASTQEELQWLNTCAFTFGNRSEGLDVVYIEQGFFGSGDVLTGQKFWSCVLVHELSHLVAGTIDVPFGTQARYAFTGIGPHTGFPGRLAIKNAENWAFFCADCAGVLTESEKMHALKIT